MTSALAFPQHHQQQQHQQHQQQQLQHPRRRKRSPNWEEFYRNGYPTDIITIDDDTPPPHTESKSSSSSAISRGSGSASSSSSASSAALSVATSSISHILLRTDSASSTPRAAAQFAHSVLPSPMTEPYARLQMPAQKMPLYGDRRYALSSCVSQDANLFELDEALCDSSSADLAAKRRKYGQPAVATLASADNKRRRLEYVAPRKPVAKAKDVAVATIADPYFVRHNPKVDDDDGHYIIVPDSELTTRYKITKLLGQGTFGKVVAAYDRQNGTECAIKIIRAVQKYRDASKIELRVLETLSMHDEFNLNRCIHLRDCFDFRNHICIVTDLLSISVFDFLKANNFVPFPASHIQRFAKQLFTSVAFLHELNLIHTDLKPENILLVESSCSTFPYSKRGANSDSRKVLNDTTIHLIDFGSATFQDEYHNSVVSTRHYRAPEIILGMGWSFPCDLWSIGCILVEFFTGEALFQTHDNVEHLAMMEAVTDRPFDRAVSKLAGRQAQKYFTRSGRLDYPNAATSKTSKKYVRAMKKLSEIIPGDDNFHRLFLDLLKRIFVYEPSHRITAREALDHPWFRESYIDEGSVSAGAF